jgi:hypothetical protein
MRYHTESIEMNLLPGRPAERAASATTVFQGYIGQVTDESVIVFPRLDRRYSIELRRQDVLDFEPGLPAGACRFVVPTTAPVEECITIRTTARRPGVAAQIAANVDDTDLDGWIKEAVAE